MVSSSASKNDNKVLILLSVSLIICIAFVLVLNHENTKYSQQLKNTGTDTNSGEFFQLDNIRDGALTLVDSRIEKGLADLLIKHFEALYYKNEEDYNSTLSPEAFKHLTEADNAFSRYSDAEKSYRCFVRLMRVYDDSILEINQNGGNYPGFIKVHVLSQKTADSAPALVLYDVGVEKQNGQWYVVWYD